MKKRITSLLCVFITLLLVTGCSNQQEVAEQDTTAMQQMAEAILLSFSQTESESLEQLKECSEYELNYVLMSSGISVEADVFKQMINSWEASEDECGAYRSHGDWEVVTKSQTTEVRTLVTYEERDAMVVFQFDEDETMEAMDVSAKYTTQEILQKAGLNTILGMGTVFVVLIFLAFVISLMKYIPILLERFQKKECEAVESKATTTEGYETEGHEEEQIDDLELVAVIAAAIAAHTGTTTDDFVVRSIKRRPSNRWNEKR